MSNTERDAESMNSIIERQQGVGTLPTLVVKKTPHWNRDGFGKYNGPSQEEQENIDQQNKKNKYTELKKRLESVRNSLSSKIPGKNHHKPYSMSNQKEMYETIRKKSRKKMLDSVKPNTSIPPKGGKYRRRKTNRHKSTRRKTKRRKTNRRKTKRRRSYRR